MDKQKQTPKAIEALDLFCGAGGLSCGLAAEGVQVKAGFDLDPHCAYPYAANHGSAAFVLADVADLAGDDLARHWSAGAVRLLAGCAPCQPFSSYANTRQAEGKSHKWGLLFHFSRLVRESLPDLVTMENVPRLEREAPFTDFLETLKSLGYHVAHGVLNAADFGAAQARKRLVLVASRLGPVFLPAPTHGTLAGVPWRTVQDAIGSLPALEAGQGDTVDPLHAASTLSPLNLRRIRASRPGGTWRDWPKDLVADCHQRDSGRHSSGVYGRMSWDKPAPTMTTLCNGYGNGRFGHPQQHRAITLREAAIFQSFPADYRFIQPGQPMQVKALARLIGNAVPPKLGEAVGRALKASLPAL